MDGLAKIVEFIEENPSAVTSARLVRFLGGMYNGDDYPVDLTDLHTTSICLAATDGCTTGSNTIPSSRASGSVPKTST